EGLRFRDTEQLSIGDTAVEAERAVDALGVPLSLRARLRLSHRFGLALGVSVVPMRMRVKLAPSMQSADEHGETVIGLRGRLQADTRLGPGRLVVGAEYGRAALSGGVVVGHVDGVALLAGYEWWFADFGW
ncbi:MAG: hypothetical protein H0T46_14550, partial [Deltaproteobacteria bacterium]|nr:hypothetical protein [Deltaproteobacteria bacterium]